MPRKQLLLWLFVLVIGGCATIRVTDPPRTADEEYLENVASKLAVDQISATVLRDRKVYVDPEYLTSSTQPSDEQQYLLGELRAKLLLSGVRLVAYRDKAEVIMEVRSQGISVNHIEFLLGLPASSIGGIFTGGIASQTPELSIIKRTQQHGFSSIAYIAYWADSGEVVAASGPFIGRTIRDDYWFLGYHSSPIGNIPPAEPAPVEGGNVPHKDGKKTTAPDARDPAGRGRRSSETGGRAGSVIRRRTGVSPVAFDVRTGGTNAAFFLSVHPWPIRHHPRKVSSAAGPAGC